MKKFTYFSSLAGLAALMLPLTALAAEEGAAACRVHGCVGAHGGRSVRAGQARRGEADAVARRTAAGGRSLAVGPAHS